MVGGVFFTSSVRNGHPNAKVHSGMHFYIFSCPYSLGQETTKSSVQLLNGMIPIYTPQNKHSKT
uniref:Uncharacterized protein n=1 Tax=Anguilla anguilla TaxID=7936 RepID=A0A0E9TZ96_ANGAN